MALVPRFTSEQIRKQMALEIAKIERVIIRNLLYLGEQCRNNAIENKGYMDRTANLKSSIGYIVVANGKVISREFETYAATATKGELTGEALARKIAEGYPTGFALIVVAGMNYAAHVESTGRNVLRSAEVFAEAELPRMLKTLGIRQA